jgi:adenosylcobyric acid synthase
MGSQIVVNGKVWKTMSSRDYFAQSATLRQAALDAYARLAERFEYIVIEGAGSIAELNLKSRDYVNLSMAQAAEAKALLVADIDRGGVFASILGTLDLLDASERALVRAFAVNRFRGDPQLFEDGVRILESRSACPCLGVFPRIDGVNLHEEDSVSLDDTTMALDAPVAIVRLPRVSNFTDFHLLRAKWISRPEQRDFEWIILPGTKNTIGDLEWLRRQGLDQWLLDQRSRGARILGVCGGYQMLGRTIADPHAMESDEPRTVAGLGLLPVDTVLEEDKIVRAGVGAYEIHLGRTEGDGALETFDHGVHADGVFGTYLHGVFESHDAAVAFFGSHAVLSDPGQPYDVLADWFTQHADLKLFEEQFL